MWKKGRAVFLEDLPPQQWTKACFRNSRYGEMSSNAVKSFKSWIREARHLPISQLIDSIRANIVRQMAKRRRKAQALADVICPKMEAQLIKVYNKGKSWLVSQSNDNVHEVHSFPSVMVDVGKRTCSCFQWQINRFPCAHAVVVIHNSGLDLYELVATFYHVAAYQNSYKQTIYPIPTIEKPSFSAVYFVIQSPAVKRPPGRPKKKRMLSKREQVQQIRCGHYQCMGNHNRKTCKEPI
ncbi:hypothetical protein ACSBR2_012432 [Camellia fascicularis]